MSIFICYFRSCCLWHFTVKVLTTVAFQVCQVLYPKSFRFNKMFEKQNKDNKCILINMEIWQGNDLLSFWPSPFLNIFSDHDTFRSYYYASMYDTGETIHYLAIFTRRVHFDSHHEYRIVTSVRTLLTRVLNREPYNNIWMFIFNQNKFWT